MSQMEPATFKVSAHSPVPLSRRTTPSCTSPPRTSPLANKVSLPSSTTFYKRAPEGVPRTSVSRTRSPDVQGGANFQTLLETRECFKTTLEDFKNKPDNTPLEKVIQICNKFMKDQAALVTTLYERSLTEDVTKPRYIGSTADPTSTTHLRGPRRELSTQRAPVQKPREVPPPEKTKESHRSHRSSRSQSRAHSLFHSKQWDSMMKQQEKQHAEIVALRQNMEKMSQIHKEVEKVAAHAGMKGTLRDISNRLMSLEEGMRVLRTSVNREGASPRIRHIDDQLRSTSSMLKTISMDIIEFHKVLRSRPAAEYDELIAEIKKSIPPPMEGVDQTARKDFQKTMTSMKKDLLNITTEVREAIRCLPNGVAGLSENLRTCEANLRTMEASVQRVGEAVVVSPSGGDGDQQRWNAAIEKLAEDVDLKMKGLAQQVQKVVEDTNGIRGYIQNIHTEGSQTPRVLALLQKLDTSMSNLNIQDSLPKEGNQIAQIMQLLHKLEDTISSFQPQDKHTMAPHMEATVMGLRQISEEVKMLRTMAPGIADIRGLRDLIVREGEGGRSEPKGEDPRRSMEMEEKRAHLIETRRLGADVRASTKLLGELSKDVNSVFAEYRNLASRQEDIKRRSEKSDLSERMPSLDERMPSLNERMPSVGERMPSVGERMPSLDERMPSLNERMPSLKERMPSLKERIPSVGEAGEVRSDRRSSHTLGSDESQNDMNALPRQGMSRVPRRSIVSIPDQGIQSKAVVEAETQTSFRYRMGATHVPVVSLSTEIDDDLGSVASIVKSGADMSDILVACEQVYDTLKRLDDDFNLDEYQEKIGKPVSAEC